ncbi:hypothetical protein [Bradyrhizobium sp. USDA 10063]
MKTAAFPLAVTFKIVCGCAYAQGTNDPMANLRACSAMEGPARLECLENLSRKIAPPGRAAPYDNWLLSETTSPVDYSPIVTATTFARGGSDGGAMQLAIHCRKGRTELVLAGPAVSRRAEEYAISYRVNADPPVQLAAASPSFGSGAAFRGDVVRLLQSLPEEGGIAVRLSTRTGAAQEGHFLLGGLKTVREKLAAACKWPHAVARPGD